MVRFLLRDSNLSAAMQSISIRVVLAVLFEITRMPPARFSPDPCLYPQVINKLHEIVAEIASGTSSTLSKSLPLTIMTICRGSSVVNIKVESSKQTKIDSQCRDPSDSLICYFILACRLSRGRCLLLRTSPSYSVRSHTRKQSYVNPLDYTQTKPRYSSIWISR